MTPNKTRDVSIHIGQYYYSTIIYINYSVVVRRSNLLMNFGRAVGSA